MTEHLAADTYGRFLAELKQRIRTAQVRASTAVNRELVLLYWQIGRDILDRQERESWGAKVIDRLATDLKTDFPDMKGFSLAGAMLMVGGFSCTQEAQSTPQARFPVSTCGCPAHLHDMN